MTKPKYQPGWYRSPIALPERSIDGLHVKHRIAEAGTTLPVIGMRQAIVRGLRPCEAMLKEPLRIHELSSDEHGVWMTDMPEELNQIAELMHTVRPRGRVLIGGLGLGILAQTTAIRPGVDRVVVVENDPRVVLLCKWSGYEVVVDDIENYLKTTNEAFDYYLLDTWQATNESTWWRTVMPLRRTIRNRWGRRPTIHCWAEDIMHGQIFRSLTTKPPHWFYDGLPVPMTGDTARRFLRDVGLSVWEKKYGAVVDKNTRRENDGD